MRVELDWNFSGLVFFIFFLSPKVRVDDRGGLAASVGCLCLTVGSCLTLINRISSRTDSVIMTDDSTIKTVLSISIITFARIRRSCRACRAVRLRVQAASLSRRPDTADRGVS